MELYFKIFCTSEKLVTLKDVNVLFSQVVTLQAQLASLKAQALQGYTNGYSMSSTQQDNIYENKFMDYLKGESRALHPAESCTPVNDEGQHYFDSDTLTCTSMQSPQLHSPHKYKPEYAAYFNNDNDPSPAMFSSNLQQDVQKNVHYCTEELQSMAFAYLN